MDPVSMSQSSYASQIITKSQQTHGNVLIQLLKAVSDAEVAQAKPLANLLEKNSIDVYA
ncbi:MAG: hypothetical protein WCX65_06050 [bacterium]